MSANHLNVKNLSTEGKIKNGWEKITKGEKVLESFEKLLSYSLLSFSTLHSWKIESFR